MSSRAHGAVEATLLEFLSRKGLAAQPTIGVAYSGGPDSTALLAAMAVLGSPVAIHVDHGIRPRNELDAELALVKATCATLGCRLIVARVRAGAVAERARATGGGIESEARRFRYAALLRAGKRAGCAAILLAHTCDDQLETILMRLLGGSGAGGLRGIPEATGPFLRPFLGLEKSELLGYLRERDIGYSTDSTNASEDYLRNRFRRELIPLLDASFPGWKRGLAGAAVKAALDEQALESAAQTLAFSQRDDGSLSAPARTLLEAPDAVAIRALVAAAGSLLGRGRVSSRMAVAALRALRAGEGAAYRGAGMELSRDGDFAILRRGLDFPRRDGYFVFIDRPCRVRVGKLEVRASWRADGTGIRADAFRFPLVVRSRRPGDSIALKDGSKRLDTIFSEWGLSEASRRTAPIVEDRDGIVAVLAAGIGGKDRYRTRPSGEAPVGMCPGGQPDDATRRFSVIVKGV